jgi:hypothetical protein
VVVSNGLITMASLAASSSPRVSRLETLDMNQHQHSTVREEGVGISLKCLHRSVNEVHHDAALQLALGENYYSMLLLD